MNPRAPILLWALCLPAPAMAERVTDADLAPIRLGRADARARELIGRKAWGPAADAVDGAAPAARFVRGWLLEKAGRPAEALLALSGVESALPTLADLTALVKAQALMKLERYPAAAAQLEDIPPIGAVGWAAARHRARALREAGRLEEARRLYRALIGSGRFAEVPLGLLGLARLEADAGRRPEALQLLRRLDLERPEHWTAKEGRSLAAGLIKADKRLARAWGQRTAAEEVARAEKLAKKHQSQAVIEALTPLTKTKMPPALACRQRYELGRALRKRREWKKARPLIEESVALCIAARSELAPWALHLAGKAAERLGFEEEAAAHYRAQMKRHPEHRLADDAGFFLVRHYLEDKEDYAAAKTLAQALVTRFPDGDMVPEALFFVVVKALEQKRYREARSLLALEARLPPRPFRHRDGGRSEYWLARIDHLTGRRSAARTGYRTVLSTAPLSWYAIMAFSRLREMDKAGARRFAAEALGTSGRGPTLPSGDRTDWAFAVPAGIDRPSWDRALLLARMGLAGPAWSALESAGVRDDRPDLLWLSAWILDRAGAHTRAHDILRRKLGEFRRFAPTGPLRKHWQIAFPTPFEGLVSREAKQTGVDRHFIWGVMREESGFNAAVQSWASAIGLMQLILPTAKRMRHKKEKKITRARLKVPAINVRLGARYLAHVKEKTGASWALIPAGYNAGGGALRRWLKARGELPLDLFVETIPYEEARWYTKRVISSWATYRALYGGRLDDPLPYVSQKTRG